jgi:F0F1-type ATP synthase membrane subunit c/vacuolar-type H+-ATPase subunit K
MKYMPRAGLLLMLLAFTVLVLPGRVAATGQDFQYSGSRPSLGMLVSLAAHSTVVAPATTQSASALVGVIAPDDSNLSDHTGRVNVQTAGVTNVLVSTLNGDLRAGDRITASSLAGVGTKATGNGWIVGVVQTALNTQTAGSVQTTVTATNGQKRSVQVASLPVSIKVTYYTSYTSPTTAVNNLAPSWLQKLADAIVHKHVSTTVLILSFILILAGLIATFTIVSSTIRGAFEATARQPLAKHTIFRTELRSLGLAAAILIFTMVAAYLLLRVF